MSNKTRAIYVDQQTYYNFEVYIDNLEKMIFTISRYVSSNVSDLQQDGGFLCVLQFPPPIKLTTTNIVEMALC
jgi:beta-lactam-binding protein with PASTA domain